jgi:pantoate--beta-alanine ligase
VREPDGLAMSSRNAYLNPKERRVATILFRALDGARAAISHGERDALRLKAAMRETLRSEKLAEPEYVEVVDAEALEPMTLLRGECLALLAVRIGAVRLIDNLLIEERDGAFLTTL